MFSSTDTLVVRVRASSCTGRDFAIYSPITLAKPFDGILSKTFTRRAFKIDSQMACNDKMLNYLIVDRGVIFKYDYINKEC
jgi:hypothetical protein